MAEERRFAYLWSLPMISFFFNFLGRFYLCKVSLFLIQIYGFEISRSLSPLSLKSCCFGINSIVLHIKSPFWK